MRYPIFSPPLELASKPPKDWSKADAEKYFEWFVGVCSERVNGLLGFLGLHESKDAAPLLTDVQEKLQTLLTGEPFTMEGPSGRSLTNEGYAIAADAGLLVAQLLIEHADGRVQWEILRRPKTDQSFNLPVLVGFDSVHLDPVAGSIGDAAWIARGNRKPDAWKSMFEFWSAKIVRQRCQ